MRQIVLDTETTGLDPSDGPRVVEIACIELVNRVPSGRHYQTYVNPERDMPDEAFRVHGLSTEFLSTQPLFAEVLDGFVQFLGEGELIIHNAEFDLKFLNAEMGLLGKPGLENFMVVDTVQMARQKFPGAPASLDALCRRFGVDNSKRQVHGALLDAELLAEVYLELMGGREPALGLAGDGPRQEGEVTVARTARPPRPHGVSEAERAAHKAFVAGLKNPIWNK